MMLHCAANGRAAPVLLANIPLAPPSEAADSPTVFGVYVSHGCISYRLHG